MIQIFSKLKELCAEVGCIGAEGGVGQIGGLHGMRRFAIEGTANAGHSDSDSQSLSGHLSVAGLTAYKNITDAASRALLRRAGFQRPSKGAGPKPQAWEPGPEPQARPATAPLPPTAFHSPAAAVWPEPPLMKATAPPTAPMLPAQAFQSPAAAQWTSPPPAFETPAISPAQGIKRTSPEELLESPNSRLRVNTPAQTPGAIGGATAPMSAVKSIPDLGTELRALKKFYEEGLMTESEYTHARRNALGLPS